jgi:trehalose utilization protein
MGEEHIILSERLEEQLKAVEWAKAEQKRLQKEKGDRISKELMEEMTPLILQRNKQFDKIPPLR